VEGFWKLIPAVRRTERGRFACIMALGAVVTLAQGMGLAGAEALFLVRLGAERLPTTFVLASLFTVGASLLYAVRVGRARNDRVFVEVLTAAALGVGLSAAAFRLGYEQALPAMLCLYFAAQAVLISHYWTFAGDFFDTLATKRLVALFTVGMSVGGLAGGLIAMTVLTRASAEALVWGWSLSFALAAVGLLLVQGRFAAWRALVGAEEDETSVSGIQAALRSLRHSALGRWLVFSALAMVLAMFVAQYVYADIMVRSFPDEAELAAFLALFVAASSGVEIAVEVAVTPWLIRRLGVPAANLAHPTVTFLSFVGLVLAPQLPAAVAARGNRELMESALAGPVRNLVYNALPGRIRSRVRAFLEGIVIYAGMSLAGVALILSEGLGLVPLSAIGAGLALLYLLANLQVRREYVGSLETELRAGRLDLATLHDELGARELAELAELWTHLLATESDPGDAVLELAPLLAARGIDGPVQTGLDHANPRVRAACIAALGASAGTRRQGGPPAEVWLRALGDGEPGVRCEAIRALPADGARDEAVRGALASGLADPDPAVRAEAASRLGGDGDPTLAAMLDAEETATVEAALRTLPARLVERATARIDDPDRALRAAALHAIARSGEAGRVPLPRLVAGAEDSDARVREAAVRALAARTEPEALELLSTLLRDPSHEVRAAAAAALAAHGEVGALAAREQLHAPEESAVGAAVQALRASGAPEAPAWLRAEYGFRVREAWEAMLLEDALVAHADGATSTGLRFLAVACGDAAARALRLAFRTLAALADESVVGSITRALRFAGGRARADALEVLTHLGDRPTSHALAVLLENSTVQEKALALRGLAAPCSGAGDALARARAMEAPWVRRAAEAASDSGSTPRDEGDEATMKRLLALRNVSLFSGLSLERLQAVHRITTESQYVAGDVIVREGDPGDELYLLIDGRVRVVKHMGRADEEQFATLGPGDYFGEIAVLDGRARTATVAAETDCTALVLRGARLRELVHEMPALAFDLLRVLGDRVRHAEERASAGRSA